LQGGVVFEPGRIGQAFSFNGIDGLAKSPFSSALDIQSAITIEAWVNPSIPASNNIPAISGRYATYQLQINSDGKVLFGLSFDHTLDQQVTSSNPLPANTFTHIVGTYDSSSSLQRLYINGVLDVNRPITSGNRMITLQPTEEPFTIGGVAGVDGLSAFSFLQELVDEVQVFSGALSDSEILSIYSSGSAGICKGGGGADGSGLFVPIVLSASGLNGSFFTSEMALTDRGKVAATVSFTYTAAFGGGSGTL
jgi:Concanavalin A-like lectin/glucanases superfamily